MKLESNYEKKKKSKSSSALFIILIVIAVLVLCFAGYKILSITSSYNESSDYYDSIRALFTPESSGSGSADGGSSSGSGSADGESQNPDIQNDFAWDFSKLYALNTDAIGYIRASGDTSDSIIDYPLVKGDDNSYYLDHLFDGTANSAGAIFMDALTVDDFDSTYCIIYGHNLRGGARMFSYLTNYKDESFFNAHPEMHIYTKDSHYIYKIFAQLTTDTEAIFYTNHLIGAGKASGNADAVSDLMDLVDLALSSNTYNTGVTKDTFSADSHVILLSTCSLHNYKTERYVVLLVRDREVAD